MRRPGLIRCLAGLLALFAGLACVATSAEAVTELAEIALWDNRSGPHLRGSTVSQRRFYPESDQRAVLGPGPSGPPHRQRDFDDLAAAGANVVMISHPAPFAEAPPYALDPAMEASLDSLVAMATRADLFVVLTFRTGPGRSEFGFFAKEAGTWFEADQVDDSVWAWAESGAPNKTSADTSVDNPIATKTRTASNSLRTPSQP